MTALERMRATVRGEPRDRVSFQPIIMLLAAREIGASYEDYVCDWRVLVEGQLAFAERFEVDVLSCCSDAWREAGDCGTPLAFRADAPPHAVRHLLEDKTALRTLRMPKPEDGPRMSDRVCAVAAFAERAKGERAVMGWVEGPVAESADLRGLHELLLDTVDDPEWLAELMDAVVEMEIAFALAQVRAGADVIGLGDAAASLVTPDFYEEHALPRVQRMVRAIQEAGAMVRLHVCGSTNHLLAAFGRTGAEMIELDHPVDFARARPLVGPEPVLLGNMDPVTVVRDGPVPAIRASCAACYSQAGERYILAAGCELPPDTPEEHIRAMRDWAREAGAEGRA